MEFITICSVQRSALAVMPSTQLRAQRVAGVRAERAWSVNRANVITGSITLSSSWPAEAASITVVSRPIARKQDWLVTSGITGLTLPGMIEEPGCSCGRLISDRPQRGPLGEQTNVVADLRELHGEALDGRGQRNVGAAVARGGDEVFAVLEVDAGDFSKLLDCESRVIRVSRHAGADGGSAEVDHLEVFLRFADDLRVRR